MDPRRNQTPSPFQPHGHQVYLVPQQQHDNQQDQQQLQPIVPSPFAQQPPPPPPPHLVGYQHTAGIPVTVPAPQHLNMMQELQPPQPHGIVQDPSGIERGKIYRVKGVDKIWDGKQWRKVCFWENCTRYAVSTDFCKTHGGGRRCKYRSNQKTSSQGSSLVVCGKSAVDGTHFCKAHGGGKRCSYPDCPKSAVGRTKFCKAHGGGKRCRMEGCPKSAVSPTDLCIAHGGGKRCNFVHVVPSQVYGQAPILQSCPKSARGSTGFCIAHGGGRRCSEPHCGKAPVPTAKYCAKHLRGSDNSAINRSEHSASKPAPRKKIHYKRGDDGKLYEVPPENLDQLIAPQRQRTAIHYRRGKDGKLYEVPPGEDPTIPLDDDNKPISATPSVTGNIACKIEDNYEDSKAIAIGETTSGDASANQRDTPKPSSSESSKKIISRMLSKQTSSESSKNTTDGWTGDADKGEELPQPKPELKLTTATNQGDGPASVPGPSNAMVSVVSKNNESTETDVVRLPTSAGTSKSNKITETTSETNRSTSETTSSNLHANQTAGAGETTESISQHETTTADAKLLSDRNVETEDKHTSHDEVSGMYKTLSGSNSAGVVSQTKTHSSTPNRELDQLQLQQQQSSSTYGGYVPPYAVPHQPTYHHSMVPSEPYPQYHSSQSVAIPPPAVQYPGGFPMVPHASGWYGAAPGYPTQGFMPVPGQLMPVHGMPGPGQQMVIPGHPPMPMMLVAGQQQMQYNQQVHHPGQQPPQAAQLGDARQQPMQGGAYGHAMGSQQQVQPKSGQIQQYAVAHPQRSQMQQQMTQQNQSPYGHPPGMPPTG